MEGVVVENGEAELITEFEETVDIFEEIQSDLIHVQKNVANGEYISIVDGVMNDEFEQWITNNTHVIDALNQIEQSSTDIFNKIEHIDESIEDDDFSDELDHYISKLPHLYVALSEDDEN